MIEDNRYKLWKNLRQRCDNPKHKDYANYGGRGITYDPTWTHFPNFCADVGERPQGLTLDRIDNEGPYVKGNVKWSTMLEQAQNKREAKDREAAQGNSAIGILGVCFATARQVYLAYGSENKKQLQLYRGPDLNAAIAARRAWERERDRSKTT